MAREGELPLGVMARVGLAARDRLLAARLPPQPGDEAGTPCARMAGSAGSSPRAASALTSSSAPGSIMASNRASMRA